MDRNFHIAELIAQKVKGKISLEGAKELQNWIEESPDHLALIERLQDNNELLNKLEVYELFDKEAVWQKLEKDQFSTKVVKMDTRKSLRYAASVLLPLMLAGGLFYYYYRQPTDSLANIDEVIQPGVQKATLVLSEGELIDLTSQTASKTIVQGSSQIVNREQSLDYSGNNIDSGSEGQESASPLIYNELITPRGGRYQLTLADGTKVTLNADSKLRFPVAFTDSTRDVYLQGEAFFEVAHNYKAFTVNTENLDVRVLGTIFNVSAYPSEMQTSATLVEGSVKLLAQQKTKLLVPGDRGIFTTGSSTLEVGQVNTALYTSWVQGKVEFENEDLESVMKRLARWYDFKYEFKNEQARNFHFTARIENTQRISTILEMLELTTNVQFELQERTIIIL
ncbi:MAG: DUF4974 domain-containing protein [Cyclobacteriaceae bacterium]